MDMFCWLKVRWYIFYEFLNSLLSKIKAEESTMLITQPDLNDQCRKQ